MTRDTSQVTGNRLQVTGYMVMIACSLLSMSPAWAESQQPADRVITGEAAWAIYDELRDKAGEQGPLKCRVRNGFWSTEDPPVLPTDVAVADSDTKFEMTIHQHGELARYERTKNLEIRRQDGLYRYNSRDDSFSRVSYNLGRHEGAIFPYYRIGNSWFMERDAPIEVLVNHVWQGMEMVIFRQTEPHGNCMAWCHAVWVDMETGVARRSEGITPSKLPNVSLVNVAECVDISFDEISAGVFEIPQEKTSNPLEPLTGVQESSDVHVDYDR